MIVVFARLLLHFIEMHAPFVYSHRCSRLHPRHLYAVSRDAFREIRHRRLRDTASRNLMSADVQQSVKECSRCNHHTFRAHLHAPYRLHAHRRGRLAFTLHEQLIRLILPDVKVWRIVERPSPFPDELLAVALCARAPHGRSFRAVKHTKLYCRRVRYQSHLTAQRIYFAHNLSLCNSAHGRVATHLRYLVHVHCHQAGLRSDVGCRCCRLTPCVSASDNNHVVIEFHILLVLSYAKIQKTMI